MTKRLEHSDGVLLFVRVTNREALPEPPSHGALVVAFENGASLLSICVLSYEQEIDVQGDVPADRVAAAEEP